MEYKYNFFNKSWQLSTISSWKTRGENLTPMGSSLSRPLPAIEMRSSNTSSPSSKRKLRTLKLYPRKILASNMRQSTRLSLRPLPPTPIKKVGRDRRTGTKIILPLSRTEIKPDLSPPTNSTAKLRSFRPGEGKSWNRTYSNVPRQPTRRWATPRRAPTTQIPLRSKRWRPRTRGWRKSSN